ncbi:hypothetical protein ACFSE1_14500, partial [Rhizobium helianthi]
SNTKPGEVGKDGKTPDASKLEALPVDKNKADAVAEEASNTKTGAVDTDGKTTDASKLEASPVDKTKADAVAEENGNITDDKTAAEMSADGTKTDSASAKLTAEGESVDPAAARDSLAASKSAGGTDGATEADGDPKYINYDSLKDLPRNPNAAPVDRYAGMTPEEKAEAQRNNRDRSAVDSVDKTSAGTEGQPWSPAADLAKKIFGSEYMGDVNKSLYNALKNTDKSFINPDILSNPGKYDEKQRMIAYLDALSAQGAYSRFKDTLGDNGYATNNSKEVMNDLQNAVKILETDQGVQTKLTENIFRRLQGGFDGQIVGHVYDDNKSYEENMNDVLSEGNRATALKNDLMASYQKDIVEGGLLRQGREAGQDYKTIFQQYNSAVGIYNSVLPESITKGSIEDVNKSYSKFFTDDFLQNLPDTNEALKGLVDAVPNDPSGPKMSNEDKLASILKEPLNAVAETYFKDNQEAQNSYKTNLTTIITAAWQLGKPGGNFDDLTKQISGYIDNNVKNSAGGMDQPKYKQALLSGVTGILQGSRAVWSGVNMSNPTPDAIGVVLLHSMAGTSQFLKAAGSTVENSSKFLGDLAGVYDGEFLAAEKKATATALKGLGNAIGNIAAVGWLPVDYHQLFQGIKSGSLDTTGTILSAIGTAGDTVGAIEGISGLAQSLLNSNFVRGAGAATRFLPAAFSTVFTAGSIASWAAWSALQIYNDVRRWKEWSGQKDEMNAQLNRLVGDEVSLYVKDPIQNPKMPLPRREVPEEEKTKTDWDAVANDAARWRNANGGQDWAYPEVRQYAEA